MNTERTAAGITYTLTYKPVKNINLRVRTDLSVAVSANRQVPVSAIDSFVTEKAGWIQAAMHKTALRQQIAQSEKTDWADSQCLEYFQKISLNIFPLFSHVLDAPPEIKVKLMKSRWGVCHIQKRYITLNKRLMNKPKKAVEYVILHEYVHFLHPNHKKFFHDTMKILMPDYKQREKLLF